MNPLNLHIKHTRLFLATLVSAATLAVTGNVFSAQGTTTMAVSLIIEGGCGITTTAMTFPTPTALALLATTAQINITCSNGTPFEIGLDAGAHSSDVAARAMQDAGSLELIVYSIYKTGAHVTVWGNTQGVDTLASAGDGFVQQFAAYGAIPVPTVIPSAGTYTDTINAFVYF